MGKVQSVRIESLLFAFPCAVRLVPSLAPCVDLSRGEAGFFSILSEYNDLWNGKIESIVES